MSLFFFTYLWHLTKELGFRKDKMPRKLLIQIEKQFDGVVPPRKLRCKFSKGKHYEIIFQMSMQNEGNTGFVVII